MSDGPMFDPTRLNADGDRMIDRHHPYASQAIDLKIDPALFDVAGARTVGEPLDHFNHRRCVLFIGRSRLNENQVKAFNKLWAPLEVRSILYGGAVQGLRANIIVVLDEPRTMRDHDWLMQEARLRLAPDGLMVGNY